MSVAVCFALCLNFRGDSHVGRDLFSSLTAAEPSAIDSIDDRPVERFVAQKPPKRAPTPNPPEAASVPDDPTDGGNSKSNDYDVVSKAEEALLVDQIELQQLLKSLGQDHPKVRKVKDRIELTQKWIADRRKDQKRTLVLKVPGRNPKEIGRILTELHGEAVKVSVDELTGTVLVAISQVKSPLEAQSLLDEIEALAKKLEPGTSVVAQQALALPPVGEFVLPAIGVFPSDEEDATFDREAKQLAMQIRAAKPDEQPKLRKELEVLTEKQFEHRQQRRKQEFESLGQRVDRLKALHKRRQENKAEVIERRVKELLDPNSDLRWEPAGSSEDEKVGKAGAASKADVIAADSEKTNDDRADLLIAANKGAAEPTYKGMTIDEALHVATTERDQFKRCEALLAMLFLSDRADPGQIIHTVFNSLRNNPTVNINEVSYILDASRALLIRLPPKIVVDLVIKEVRPNTLQKPTRDLVLDFLATLRRGHSVYYGLASLTKNPNMTGLPNDSPALRQEIRRQSRRLIHALIDIANHDESLSDWVLRCADQIVHICDQPITTFPDLVPIAEREFAKPYVTPTTNPGRHLQGPVAVLLLAEAGLQIPDVLAFAEGRIADRTVIDANANNAFRINLNSTEFHEFQTGVRCLVALAPHSPDSVKRLIEILRTRWNEIQETSEMPEGLLRRPSVDFQPVYECFILIGGFSRIGSDAAESISLLQEIADSDKSLQFLDPTPGPRSGPSAKPSLKDRALGAIQLIKEAKPKPKPELLTEEDALDKDVEASQSAVPVKEPNPVARQALEPALPKAVPPKVDEPKYNGITITEWYRVLESERNPNKVLDAIRAMQYLVDQAEPKQLVRTIFQTMTVFGGPDRSDTDLGILNDVVNQSQNLLLKLPPKFVVEGTINELANAATKKPIQDFVLDLLTTERRKNNSPLCREIRLGSRRLIHSLVNASHENEDAKIWALLCVNEIVQISDQPITTYPELVPFVEEMFSRPYDRTLPIVNGRSYEFPVAAVMLGEAGLHIPEVLAFAEERIQDRFREQLPNGFRTVSEFQKGVACLTAVAPHSPEAVNRLIGFLKEKWGEFNNEKVVTTPPQTRRGRGNTRSGSLSGESVVQFCDVVAAPGRIGTLAIEAVPVLREIADSPNMNMNCQILRMQRTEWRTIENSTIRDLANEAIKQIESAKPKSKPEPLPEGMPLLKDGGTSQISSPIEAPNQVARRQIDAAVLQSASPKTATPNEGEPTYNGVTLSEWLRLLKTERNADKVAESLLAMIHLIDEAEPRQLVKATLHTMRLQGTQHANPRSGVIVDAASRLLILLPSKVVTEEIIAEVASNYTRKPTRDFFDSFLRFLEIPKSNLGGMGGGMGSIDPKYQLPNMDANQLAESKQRLREEICRRSRKLISTFVNASKQDDSLKVWAMFSAAKIVEISQQRIAAYPDLVPLVVCVFEMPDPKMQNGGINYRRTYTAKLLGESNLRIPDVLDYASERLHGFPESDLPETNSDSRFELGLGIDCLLAISPHSSAAETKLNEVVKRLSQILRDKWTSIPETTSKEPKVPDPIENALLMDCDFVIRTLGKIGTPAKDLVPFLREIVDSPLSAMTFVATNSGNGFGFPSIPRETAKAAIKQIEEAKPKPEPEPLPADDGTSRLVPSTKSRVQAHVRVSRSSLACDSGYWWSPFNQTS